MARSPGLLILSKLAKLAGLIVVLGVLAAGVLLPYVGGAGLAVKAGADKFLNTACSLTEEPVQQKTTLLASDGKTVLATLFDQNRAVIPLAQVPQSVIDALISTEDRRFYEHHGVDLRGLIRGALKTSSGNTQGASTLTEQYVKQVNYYNAITAGDEAAANAAIDQNLDRKISDAQCAIKLEGLYTKRQILEKYLNIAFFGENAYGIQTASQTYFGIPAKRLSIAQAAMLVGLVRAPSLYDPYVNRDDAKSRRDQVIENMRTQHNITDAQAAAAKRTPIVLVKQAPPARGCANAQTVSKVLNVGFFCDYVTDYLHRVAGLTEAKINTGGLTVITSLDKDLQNSGQQAIWSQSGLDPKNGHGYILVMPSITPTTGAVTTMITDLHYGVKKGDGAWSVNHVFTDAYAGSGSTYKYFTALAALKAGVPADFSVTAGSPYKTQHCPSGTDPSGGYVNAGSYRATYPLSQALPLSSNTYFVGMEDQFFGCQLGPIVNTATGLGMNYLTSAASKDALGRTAAVATIQDSSATFTLGQRPTSALELTGAFSALANDGIFCPPTPILSITLPDGKPQPYNKTSCGVKFTPYVARTLVKIMTNDTDSRGTGGTATSYFRDWYNNGGSLVAGKTGTNNATDCVGTGANQVCTDNGKNSALWFVGITPTLVSAAAIVNPLHPPQTIADVPGITAQNDGSDTFGAAASKFWLEAYGTTLQRQSWEWPTVASTPGEPVYLTMGNDVTTTEEQVTSLGYKYALYPGTCGSSVTEGNIAYYSPKIALPGATITLCQSSGVPLNAPPKPKPSKTSGSGSGSRSGSASGSATTTSTGQISGQGTGPGRRHRG